MQYLNSESHPLIFAKDINRSLSFATLKEKVSQCSQALKRDFPEKSIIAIQEFPSLEYLVFLVAVFHANMTALPLNPSLPESTVHNLIHSLDRCYLFHSQNKLTSAKSVKNYLENCQHLPIQPLKNLAIEQPVSLIRTSGSSGEPKLALHSFGNHYYSALGSHQNIPFESSDRWLLTLPLYHVGGLSLIFRSLLNGGTLVLAKTSLSIADQCLHEEITHLSLVTTQLFRLIKDDQLKHLKSLKHLLLGGSSIPHSLIRQCLVKGINLHTTYGSTEMSSQITTVAPGANLSQLMTAGHCLPYRELNLIGGEILVRGKVLFQGYLNGKQLERPFEEEGWFRTGDLGYLDKNEQLIVTGRIDNQFISGGENIQPEEIEMLLNQIEGVEEAIVVPHLDPEFGERPLAFVKTSQLDPTAYINHLKVHLPSFKIPAHFLLWPQLRTGFKISRKMLKKIANEYGLS